MKYIVSDNIEVNYILPESAYLELEGDKGAMRTLVEVEDDKEKINTVKEFVLKEKAVKNVKIDLIKYGAYYKLQLSLELDPKLSLLQVTKIENKIKRDIIRHRSLKIKYVTIFVTNKI